MFSLLTIFVVHVAAIKNALKQENLNPEIEEKLLQLQRYQEKQMKGGVDSSVASNQNHGTPTGGSTTTPRAPSRKRPAPASANSQASSTPISSASNATAGGNDRETDWSEPPRKKVPPNRQEHRDVSR